MANPLAGTTIYVKLGTLPGVTVHKGVTYFPIEPTTDEDGNVSHELAKESEIPDEVFKQAMAEQKSFLAARFNHELSDWKPPARFRKAKESDADDEPQHVPDPMNRLEKPAPSNPEPVSDTRTQLVGVESAASRADAHTAADIQAARARVRVAPKA